MTFTGDAPAGSEQEQVFMINPMQDQLYMNDPWEHRRPAGQPTAAWPLGTQPPPRPRSLSERVLDTAVAVDRAISSGVAEATSAVLTNVNTAVNIVRGRSQSPIAQTCRRRRAALSTPRDSPGASQRVTPVASQPVTPPPGQQPCIWHNVFAGAGRGRGQGYRPEDHMRAPPAIQPQP